MNWGVPGYRWALIFFIASRLTCVSSTPDMSPKSRIAAENLYDVNRRRAQRTSVLPSG